MPVGFRKCWLRLPSMHFHQYVHPILQKRNYSSVGYSIPKLDGIEENVAERPINISNRKKFMSLRYDPKILSLIIKKGLGERRVPKDTPVNKRVSSSNLLGGEKKIKFFAGASNVNSFINSVPGMKELAIIGRSNVGKSRLLNASMNTTIARVKDKPGSTQSINWYKVGPRSYIVDMPGYGFAYAKEDYELQWNKLNIEFLSRSTVCGVLILVDARHGLKCLDHEFLRKLCSPKLRHLPLRLLLTKCDLLKDDILARRYRVVCEDAERYGITSKDVFMVSSRSGAGILDLRNELKNLLSRDLK